MPSTVSVGKIALASCFSVNFVKTGFMVSLFPAMHLCLSGKSCKMHILNVLEIQQRWSQG